MIVTDKNIKSLIKKIQKKCEAKTASSPIKVKKEEVVEEHKEASDMFREMKKLPFSE